MDTILKINAAYRNFVVQQTLLFQPYFLVFADTKLHLAVLPTAAKNTLK